MQLFKILFAFSILGFPVAHASVWETTNQWSAAWEDRYSTWVNQEWSTDYFAKPGTPYFNLSRDCADVVYTMRMIYSSLNGLPFVMKDATGGKRPISNEMKRWDQLPQEKRLRAFAVLIMQVGSTVSLPNDTLPVSIDRAKIRPGALLVTDHKSHHSLSLKDLSVTGVPTWIYSSRPAKVTILKKIGFLSEGFTFPNGITTQSHAGLMNFREPDDLYKQPWEIPGFSEEQYHPPFVRGHWIENVKAKLALKKETPSEELTRVMASTCDSAGERIANVQDAMDFLATQAPQACLDASRYDDFSTPSRDQRLLDSFQELKSAYTNSQRSHASLNKILAEQVESVLIQDDLHRTPGVETFCPVQISKSQTLSLGEIRRRSFQNLLSSNPNDPFEYRWGEKSGHSEKAKRCPTF